MAKIPLGIDAHLPNIVGELRKSHSLVIVAEPGAGKTTRVPPAILSHDLLGGEHPNLVLLQPRRVAARAAAQRIAEENDWEIGREIGYHIRFEKRIGPQTRLRVLTEGILTRQLLADPFLEGIGAVILDEFHERSIHSDLAIAMLREMQQTVRPDLLLIVMSATLAAEPAAKFLGDCPIVRVPGRTFPVDIEYSSDSVDAAVRSEIEKSTGDVLVFLPGMAEIRAAADQLQSRQTQDGVEICQLHSSVPAEEQDRALRPSSKRKIILATNIAETSLTIPGVRVVIDSGLARVPRFDPARGLDRLELKRISKASATQRAGRAGRTGPGKCVRLWTAKQQAALEDFELPEICRVDLSSVLLDIYGWGKTSAEAFGWFERPPEDSIVSAQSLLEMLGAADQSGITPLGKKLMKLPVHPRIGRLLLAAADEGCAEDGATLAAMISEQEFSSNDGDLLSALHQQLPWLVKQSREQLLRIANQLSKTQRKSPSIETIRKLILLAYPDRVCRRRANNPRLAVMVGGGGVRIPSDVAAPNSEFFVALDARHDSRARNQEAIVSQISAIEQDWLSELFPQSVVRERVTEFDSQSQRVIARNVVRYRDLILSEDRNAAPNAREAGEVLAKAVAPRAAEIFAGNEAAASVLARVAFLRQSMPEHPWPKFDDPELSGLLAELCVGKRSVEELGRAGLAAALLSQLKYPLDRLLSEHAPESLEVPTGNRISLDYSAGRAPILAVRLQEVFGWTNTPRIAGGRVAVVLHLLGPNYRPAQITDDLKSFWANAYFQVRKDLRVRYPKHSWPEDPLSAKPEAKGRRR